MYSTEGGLIVIKCWNSIPDHYPQVRLQEFTLMPNHIHGILEIMDTENFHDDNAFENPTRIVEKFGRAQDVEPLPNSQRFEYYKNKSLWPKRNEFQHIIPGSLGSIIRGFEIGVTKWFRQNTNVRDVWQRNFNESIIRTERSYHRILKYIRNNQKNWTRDRFYKKK